MCAVQKLKLIAIGISHPFIYFFNWLDDESPTSTNLGNDMGL